MAWNPLPRKQEFKEDESFGQMMKQGAANLLTNVIPQAGFNLLGKYAQDAWQNARKDEVDAAMGKVNVLPVVDEFKSPVSTQGGVVDAISRLAGKNDIGKLAQSQAPVPSDDIVSQQQGRLDDTMKFLQSPEVKLSQEKQSAAPAMQVAQGAASAASGGSPLAAVAGAAGGPQFYKAKSSSKSSYTDPQALQASLGAVEPEVGKYNDLFAEGKPTQSGLEDVTQQRSKTMQRIVDAYLRDPNNPDYATFQRLLDSQAAELPQIANATTSSRNSMRGLVDEASDLKKQALGAGRVGEESSEEWKQLDRRMLRSGGGGGGGAGSREPQMAPEPARKEADLIRNQIGEVDRKIAAEKQAIEKRAAGEWTSDALKALETRKESLGKALSVLDAQFKKQQGYGLGLEAVPGEAAGFTASAKAGATAPIEAEGARLRSELMTNRAKMAARLKELAPTARYNAYLRMIRQLESTLDEDAKAELQALKDSYYQEQILPLIGE